MNTTRSTTLVLAGLLQVAGCFAWVSAANAQSYSIQQIGLFDAAHTNAGDDLFALNATGQVLGLAYRNDGGDDTWLYSPTTHTSQVIGLIDVAHSKSTGFSDNNPVDLNAAGQAIGIASRYSGDAGAGYDAWLYSPTTNTSQIVGLVDPVHTQTNGSSANQPISLSASGQVVGVADRTHYDNFYSGSDIWYYSPATHSTQVIGLTGSGYTAAYAGPYGSTDTRFVGMNAAGQVAGEAEPLINGAYLGVNDAWLYSPMTNTTQRIGIYDALQTVGASGNNGYNSVTALNAVGQVAGTANHYVDIPGSLPYNGQDAWIYSPTINATTQIGLVDHANTRADAFSYHQPVAINDGGQVAGTSKRYSDSAEQGQDAWLYSPTTRTSQLIGLSDGAHMQTGGYTFNQPNALNSSGEVIGFAKRYNGGAEQGQDAWYYSSTTNTTQSIGLTDGVHTRADGTTVNDAGFLNVGGLVVGSAKRYIHNSDPAMSDAGMDSWLFDPITRITYNLVSSPSPSGFASSYVNYLGDDGTVLGSYAVNGGATQDAFLWTETGGFHDLGDLIQGGLTASGWANLADAFGANGAPYIIGDGTIVGGSGNRAFELTITASLPGDYNHDGVVDTSDFVIWRKGLGNDFTQADYNVWRANFGRTAGSGSGASTNVAVPEPATLVLLVLAAAGLYLRRSGAA